MGGLSIWHLLILALFILVLFGGNRFSAMMGDVAKGLKSFKQGMSDDSEEEQRKREAQQRAIRHDPQIDVTPERRPAETVAPPPPPPPPPADETR